VANPQAAFSTPASIASDTESDPTVLPGQANYIYLRGWNRGVDAPNAFATLYWSPPSTLVTPDLWTLLGSAYYPDLPPGSLVEVCNPGIVWPADKIPAVGHYCFVAMIGNAAAAAPDPSSFATFDDFMNYVYANNNLTWRNFNVGQPGQFGLPPHLGHLQRLRFLIAGAWDQPRPFEIEVETELPDESRLLLDLPHWLGRAARPGKGEVTERDDPEHEPSDRRRRLIPLPAKGRHSLGELELPRGARARSSVLVEVPEGRRREPHSIVIRQLYKGREAGRITWVSREPRRHG
jgi:hypothetical protein